LKTAQFREEASYGRRPVTGGGQLREDSMDGGQPVRQFDGREALARMFPRTETWREGYYEGETEDGGRVLFLVPSKTNVIARFQVDLDLLTTSATQQDYPSGLGFEARDVRISELYGAFRHSSCQHGLFALHGGLGSDGKAHGRCIGVVNGGARHGDWGTDFHFGSSNWRRWEAAWKTTEDDPNAPSFRNWDY
jgi:hypothetical protein